MSHVAYTNTCYRMAIKALHGVGISKYGSTDDHWIYPTAYSGACQIFDNENETISLVCDNASGKFYRIGVPEQWKDKKHWQYGGYDIPCKLKIKEHTAPAGEYVALDHVESHVHMRPFWETNRNENGYGADGFLDDYALSLQMYEDGEPTTPAAKILEVPRYGDYAYRKRVEAQRLQLEIVTTTSAWRMIKVQQMMQAIDKQFAPGTDFASETQWQQEMKTPYLWITRRKSDPLLNMATARQCTGTYDQLYTGADTYARSAIAFGAADGISDTIQALTGDFTLYIWLFGVITFPATIWRIVGTTTLEITLPAAGSIRFNDGTNDFTRVINYTGTGWGQLVVQRSGTSFKYFENGVSAGSQILTDSTLVYDGIATMMQNTIGIGFDARIIPRAVSAKALLYYYNDCIEQHCSGTLPISK